MHNNGKVMKRFLLFLCLAVCLIGCESEERMAKDRQVVLIYLAGNNSLSKEVRGDMNDLKSSYLPETKEKDKIVLVYVDSTGHNPVLVRLSRDSRDNAVEDIIMEYPSETNSASALTLQAVIADAEKAWPAAHHGLILWSHGSGYLPPGYFVNPKDQRAFGDRLSTKPDPYAYMVKSDDAIKSFAEQDGAEIDIKDLRSALSGIHYDFILFDACLMGDVEVAYELRNSCDFILFSPTEILSDGFPYRSIIKPIFTQQPEAAMRSIGKAYMDYYRSFSYESASATISLVRTAGLEALAVASKPIFQRYHEKILTIDRSRIQPYFRDEKHHWFYDFDDLVMQLATEEEYQSFTRTLDGAVIYRDATEIFIDLPIKHYGGLGIYIPRPEYTVLNNYYRTLAWNQASGLVE